MPIRYDLVTSQFHLKDIHRNVDVDAKVVLRSGVTVEGVTKSYEEVEGSLFYPEHWDSIRNSGYFYRLPAYETV